MKIPRQLLFALVVILTVAPTSVGWWQGLPPGLIAYVREETGAIDPTRRITNLYLIEAQNPNSRMALTSFTTPAMLVEQPAWSKDYQQLAFASKASGDALPTEAVEQAIRDIKEITRVNSLQAAVASEPVAPHASIPWWVEQLSRAR